jgi:class 3 adenylate cyclase
VRIYRDNLTRIAEFERELWQTDIEEPLLAEGLSIGDMVDRSNAMAIPLQDLSDQTLLLLHRRALETVVFANQVDRLEEALDEAGIRRRGGRDVAIAFMDLSGYTRLTEESGDVAAADLSRRLAELVHDVAIDHDGRVVKMLGDGVMFHLRDPAQAAAAGLEMVERARDAGLPPARVGVNAGPVVIRDGDYFGRTVNVAARVVDKAGPTQVLATAAVVEATASEGVSFTEAGTYELKGVAEPVPLFVASRS